MKIIRVPLTDIYGRNFMTGEVVDESEIKRNVERNQVEKHIENMSNIMSTLREDGKVFVDGLGWVS